MSHSGSSCYWECFLPALLLLTATFIICYFSGLQLGFPSSCVEICFRLVHEGPARARPCPQHPWGAEHPCPVPPQPPAVLSSSSGAVCLCPV